jgi:hypothetical protein
VEEIPRCTLAAIYVVLRTVVDEPSTERRGLLVERVMAMLPPALKARVIRVATQRVQSGRLIHVPAQGPGGCADEGCH